VGVDESVDVAAARSEICCILTLAAAELDLYLNLLLLSNSGFLSLTMFLTELTRDWIPYRIAGVFLFLKVGVVSYAFTTIEESVSCIIIEQRTRIGYSNFIVLN